VERDTVDGRLVDGEEMVEGSGGTVQHAESVMEGCRAAARIATDFSGESIEFAAKRKAGPLHLLRHQEGGKVVCEGGGGVTAEGRYRASQHAEIVVCEGKCYFICATSFESALVKAGVQQCRGVRCSAESAQI
jgi:hypothetical protein